MANVLAGIIERRIRERIPAPYLTHEAWLQGYRFYVDERVIVPRSFLAPLILEHLHPDARLRAPTYRHKQAAKQLMLADNSIPSRIR